MIRINLATQETLQPKNNTLRVDTLIVLITCVVIYFGIEHYAATIDEEIFAIDDRIAQQNKIRDELSKEIEKSKEIMTNVEAARIRGLRLKQLGQGRKSSVIILDHLQIKHPERMWFDKVTFTSASNQLELRGFALDHAVIADYIKRLKETGEVDVSDASELKDFIPKQLQKFSSLEGLPEGQSKSDKVKSFEIVDLKSLKSEVVDGVTLQKFEITIQIKNG